MGVGLILAPQFINKDWLHSKDLVKFHVCSAVIGGCDTCGEAERGRGRCEEFSTPNSFRHNKFGRDIDVSTN